jgi:glutathione S-transferase
MTDRPVLVTIPISHYCEKARWALDRAGVAYEESRHLPALHRVAVRRAGGGRTAPLLVCPRGEVLRESRDIVVWADARATDPAARIDLSAEAWALADDYDERLGPATRLWVYHQMFDHPKLVQHAMTDGVPGWQRRAFGVGNRALGKVIARVLVINDETAVEAERTFRSIWADADARLADGRRYLAGDRFSVADLTFAALSAPLIGPPNYGVRLPDVDDLPPGMVDVVREHRDTRAGRHALRMFEEERGRRVESVASA